VSQTKHCRNSKRNMSQVSKKLTSSGVHCPFVERLVGPVVLLQMYFIVREHLLHLFIETTSYGYL